MNYLKATFLKLKALPFLILLIFLFNRTNAQRVVADSLQSNYKKSLFITHAAAGTVLFAGLYSAWFKDYNNGKFHLFNDNKEWMQIDKIGHAYSNFQITNLLCEQYRWVGFSEKKSAFYSFAFSNLYFLGIEMMDGFSEGWGFSTMDVAANLTGSSLSAIQQRVWKESKIQLKFGYAPSPYPKYRPDLLGKNFQTKFLKDYNAQSYWLAVSPFAFSNEIKWWHAFQLAFGYGANGMIAANASKQNAIGFYGIDRYRQYLFSFDLDWTKLPVKNQHLRKFLKCLNAVKIPLPQLVIANGKAAFQPIPLY